MASFPEFVYWVLSYPTFRGIVLGGLLAAFVLPSALELLNWRRG